MISFQEFEVLKSCASENVTDMDSLYEYYERHTHYRDRLSRGQLQAVRNALVEKGYLTDYAPSSAGMAELNSCRVENAVILAAGGAEINTKTVYSLPKGLFKFNGETLIERQIKQLQEAGICQIFVVVGIKKELYFYLEDKYGVTLVVNPCPKKNNIYSIYTVAERLGNSYICNCDNYFEENPFSQFEYHSFHATVFKEDSSRELLVRKNQSGRITEVFTDPDGGECSYGHAFLCGDTSRRLCGFLQKEISNFRVDSLFWEEFVGRHIQDMDIYAQPYESWFLKEFDTIQEVQEIDDLFVENVSHQILDTICRVLGCGKGEIQGVEISEKGLTNLLFTFAVRGTKYIFRYPGGSSADIIYRRNEVCAQRLANQCGVDSTLVYIDEAGCKLSRFVEDTVNLAGIYYRDIEFMKQLARSIRTVHEAGRGLEGASQYFLNPMTEADRLLEQARCTKGDLKERFHDIREQVLELFDFAERDGIPKTICHNDINADNCLLTGESFDVIDWEFAGYNDPAYDFGRVIAGYDWNDPDIDRILEAYFQRKAEPIERLHWIAYVGIHNWYYLCWALYKESINEDTREWMLFFYKQVKSALRYALPRYRAMYGIEK